MTQAAEGVLAVIPARGGSKGIPRKNLARVGGKPLIAWTIECALASAEIQRVVVSTDDAEIADVSRALGAEVPFMRPPELAQDETPGAWPIAHAAEWLATTEGYEAPFVVCLQPTSPLRSSEDVEGAVRLAREKRAEAVVSVSLTSAHPYWTRTIEPDGTLRKFTPVEEAWVRRQDLPQAYVLNGAIFLASHELLVSRRTFYTDRTLAFVMPEERSLDVDTTFDLTLVDLLLSRTV